MLLKCILLCALIFVSGGCIFCFFTRLIIAISSKVSFREGVYDLTRKTAKRDNTVTVLCGGLLSIVVFQYYTTWLTRYTVFAFFILLIVVATMDQATMEIPNTFVIAALVLGIISIFTMPGTSRLSRILGMFVVSVPLLLITLLVPGAFGGGDIKLMAACGLFLGTKLTLLSFAFAVLTGGLYGLWLLVMKKKSGKEHFAFGPFLCLGMAAALFIGDRVWDWYAGLLYL